MPLFFSSSLAPGNTVTVYRIRIRAISFAIKLTRHTCNLTPFQLWSTSSFIVASQHHIHPSAKQFDIKKFSIFFFQCEYLIFSSRFCLVIFSTTASLLWSELGCSPSFDIFRHRCASKKCKVLRSGGVRNFLRSNFFFSPPVWTLEKWVQGFVEGVT